MMPYELMHYETADYEIDVWFYPIVDLVRVYLNKETFDTIHLDNQKLIVEHPTLGRWHL